MTFEDFRIRKSSKKERNLNLRGTVAEKTLYLSLSMRWTIKCDKKHLFGEREGLKGFEEK